jgi:hypothetical protein
MNLFPNVGRPIRSLREDKYAWSIELNEQTGDTLSGPLGSESDNSYMANQS